MIDDATTDQDLRVPPSNHFEKLRGKLADFHSIRVNKLWRLIFRWDGSRGEAQGSISMTTVIVEVSDADDKTQAGKRRRNPGSGIHGADGINSGRVGQGHGRATQARQRALQ
jgi:plasmid maintenance system killer protein